MEYSIHNSNKTHYFTSNFFDEIFVIIIIVIIITVAVYRLVICWLRIASSMTH